MTEKNRFRDLSFEAFLAWVSLSVSWN